MQHTIKICKYHPPCVDKCVLFTFASPIIPQIYVPDHDLNANSSLNLDASLSFRLWMYLEKQNYMIICTINKKSAKLASKSQDPSPPHTYRRQRVKTSDISF